MPNYDYECDKSSGGCGHTFEVFQKITDSLKRKCPKCKKSKLRRLLGVPSVIFKGTGWTPKGNN